MVVVGLIVWLVGCYLVLHICFRLVVCGWLLLEFGVEFGCLLFNA